MSRMSCCASCSCTHAHTHSCWRLASFASLKSAASQHATCHSGRTLSPLCCLSICLSLLLICFLFFLWSLQLLSWQHMPRRSARQPALDRKVSRDVPHAACHAIDATQSLMTCRMGLGLARWHQLSGRG